MKLRDANFHDMVKIGEYGGLMVQQDVEIRDGISSRRVTGYTDMWFPMAAECELEMTRAEFNDIRTQFGMSKV